MFRFVLFRELELWVAQCLEVDIAVQGKTLVDALRSLELTLTGRIAVCEREGIDPFDLPPAPKDYWDLFYSGSAIRLKTRLMRRHA